MIRVVIADDHQTVLDGLCALLEKENDIQVIGQAVNGLEAVLLAKKLRPDVLVMDLMMPEMNGIRAAEFLQEQHLDARVVVLSMYSDPGLVRQAVASGILGYVLKSSPSESLLEAIRAAALRQTYFNGVVEPIVAKIRSENGLGEDHSDPLALLSPREREILQLIAEGHPSAEIAKMLSISPRTVETHRTNLFAKLDVHNLAGLVRMAVKLGLVNQD
jgi:Response regulator containing a CheY-like receiver domain and an HTH DNA-binding domain